MFRREKMVVPSGTAALILTVPKPMTAVEEPAVMIDEELGEKSEKRSLLLVMWEVQPLSTIQSLLGSRMGLSPPAAMSTCSNCR